MHDYLGILLLQIKAAINELRILVHKTVLRQAL